MWLPTRDVFNLDNDAAPLKFQLESINVSVSGVVKSFMSWSASSTSVLQLQNELAGIGARVAGLESGLESFQVSIY